MALLLVAGKVAHSGVKTGSEGAVDLPVSGLFRERLATTCGDVGESISGTGEETTLEADSEGLTTGSTGETENKT